MGALLMAAYIIYMILANCGMEHRGIHVGESLKDGGIVLLNDRFDLADGVTPTDIPAGTLLEIFVGIQEEAEYRLQCYEHDTHLMDPAAAAHAQAFQRSIQNGTSVNMQDIYSRFPDITAEQQYHAWLQQQQKHQYQQQLPQATVPDQQQGPSTSRHQQVPLRALGEHNPTPAELAAYPAVEAAARNFLAFPHQQQPPFQHILPEATGPLRFGMPQTDALAPKEDARISVVGNALTITKTRTPTSSEWLAWMIQVILILHAMELIPSTVIPSDVVPFAKVTTAKILQSYVVWIFELLQVQTWEHMYTFDKFIREKMTREQGGSFDPDLLTHIFFTREMSTSKRAALPPRTPVRRNICWNFNKVSGCNKTAAQCLREHVCQKCGDTGHAKATCTKR